MRTYPVYIGRCHDYDADRVTEVLKTALGQIPLRKPITGKVVIKPNLVMAHPKVATEAYTRKEVIEGIIRVVKASGKGLGKIDVVEKSGLGVTTASMFRYAGYRKLARKYGVGLRAMEERPQVKVVIRNGKVHQYITVAREMAECDFLIFAPKLKTNVLAHGYSGALKLNIGTVDSRERLYHHNRDLPAKIVDILEVANPDLIVTDGIRFCFGGNQMTQPGIDLGLIVVSNNAVAHDMVCAKLLNLDPEKIEHIREAYERGYGPSTFKEIEISGDYAPEEARSITKTLDYGYYPVEQFSCNFNILSGTPYCVGGCHGIFLDWLHMIKDKKPKLLRRFPAIYVLIGRLEKEIRAKKVLLVGNCAMASRMVYARRIVRIKGCPPSHKRIVWVMMVHFLLLSPLVCPSMIIDGFVLYPLKKLKGWLMNLHYKPLGKQRR